MKYCVMGKAVKTVRKIYLKNGTSSGLTIEGEEYGRPKEVFDKMLEEYLEYLEDKKHEHELRMFCFSRIYKVNLESTLHSEDKFVEWKEIKNINILEGELRNQDKYEIDGKYYDFEICYNQNKDRMEVRLNYIVDKIKDENYESVEKWNEEYMKLVNSHKQKEEIKKEVIREYEEAIKETREGHDVEIVSEVVSEKYDKTYEPWYKRLFGL